MSVRSMFVCLILTFCVCLLVCRTPLQAAQQGPTPQLESLFLGPKAETGDFLRELLQSIVQDQSAWRQGFHPEDRPSISPQTLAAPEAAATRTSLKQQLSAHAALPILSGKKHRLYWC